MGEAVRWKVYAWTTLAVDLLASCLKLVRRRPPVCETGLLFVWPSLCSGGDYSMRVLWAHC
jgi:hypothetical protein